MLDAIQYLMIGCHMASSYRLTLEKFLSELDVKADRVLGVGDAQLQTKGRTKSWDVKEYLIVDLPEPHVSSPKPDIEFDLNQDAQEYIPNILLGKADLIFCLEVFDYIYNPKKAFEWLAMFLREDGTAWVSFPSFYPLHQPVEDDALRYMPAGIVKLAESAGLSIEQMIPRRPESNALEQFFSIERLRSAKHEDHNFMGWICEFKK